MQKSTVYILLGGNLGNLIDTFEKACAHIELKIGTILRKSALYSSKPWGFESNDQFLNQVLSVETTLEAHQVMHALLNIEAILGRTRKQSVKYESRIIDLDLLFYNDLVTHMSDLTIPHPRLQFRKFTLVPLAEIAPELIHPTLHRTVTELLAECKDQSDVKAL